MLKRYAFVFYKRNYVSIMYKNYIKVNDNNFHFYRKLASFALIPWIFLIKNNRLLIVLLNKNQLKYFVTNQQLPILSVHNFI